MSNSNYIWWKHGVIYQIYPRSFMDSNADGVGDLQGIIEKLDYLKSLGIEALWISPIYPSPMADFGYDVADYTDIHPLFGDMATFDTLLKESHARDIKIILDFVPNHTSDEHTWFIESRSSRNNPKRDWYIWRDARPDGSPPNNWISFFGGSAWQWDEKTEQYYLHLFVDKQPDLNWRNPAVKNAMHDVLRFWLDKGVDGFRMDVVTFILKHPDFLDNPERSNTMFGEDRGDPTEHLYDINQPEVHQVIHEFRRIFDTYQNPERATIGETWLLNPKELVSYHGTPEKPELHLPFNFTLMKQPWNVRRMRQVIENYYAAMPENGWPNFVMGSHDEPRLGSSRRYGFLNHRSAAMLLMTLWGTPTWYYGDELGMVDADIPLDRRVDPQGIGTGNVALSRDPERTPMQWNDFPNAGFSPEEVETWLPVAANYTDINVATQDKNPASSLNFFRTLLKLRRDMPVLHDKGIFQFIDGLPDDVMAYTRERDGSKVLIILNFENQNRSLNLSAHGKSAEVLLCTHLDRPGPVMLAALDLRPHEGLLLKI